MSISTMTSCTRPPPIGVDPPLAMLSSPADTAASRSPELRSRPSDSAMSSPSDDTTVASLHTGHPLDEVRDEPVEVARLRAQLASSAVLLEVTEASGAAGSEPGPVPRRRRVRVAVLLGLPAALALGVAGEQLVHAVRAHRVGVGVARRRRPAVGWWLRCWPGTRVGSGASSERSAGSSREAASAGADVRFVVPSAPNVSKGGAKPGSTVGANVASRSKGAQAGPASPARWSVRAHGAAS